MIPISTPIKVRNSLSFVRRLKVGARKLFQHGALYAGWEGKLGYRCNTLANDRQMYYAFLVALNHRKSNCPSLLWEGFAVQAPLVGFRKGGQW